MADVYSVITESTSDKPLAKLLEELLNEMIETDLTQADESGTLPPYVEASLKADKRLMEEK